MIGLQPLPAPLPQSDAGGYAGDDIRHHLDATQALAKSLVRAANVVMPPSDGDGSQWAREPQQRYPHDSHSPSPSHSDAAPHGSKRKASMPLDGWLQNMSMNSPSPGPESVHVASPPPEGPGPSNWASPPSASLASLTLGSVVSPTASSATLASQSQPVLGHYAGSTSSLNLAGHKSRPTTSGRSRLRHASRERDDGSVRRTQVYGHGAHERSRASLQDPRHDSAASLQQPGDSRERGSNGMDGLQALAEAGRRQQFPDGRLGILPPEGKRSYSAIKLVGDGSFGTVWLCDWSSPVPPSTTLSAMQCGAGARAEWVGKRLVAVKRMKRVWKGGWEEASRLGELVSLRDIPSHPAIIPLYDAFVQPDSRELYFVFECMEGNLYQLTKSRKGRPLAAGLVASVFHQIVGGLHHIHQNGYFHRDMKPENLLVTTTGLQDYMPVIDPETQHLDRALVSHGQTPPQRPNPRVEKDVTVIVKLADFGLARSLTSQPPYTEYVSTRWYRAPEVLLRSKDYSAPVDMWALGTILAEVVNLKALFPGQGEVDQVYRICEVLGDPSRDYGHDERGRQRGGGDWDRGIKMAKAVGFAFPKKTPINFLSLFSPSVPVSLIDCISDLLKYNPKRRLTSAQCMEHPYFDLTLPHLRAAARLPRIPFSQGQPPLANLTEMLQQVEQQRQGGQQMGGVSPASITPRSVPPSHSHSPVQNKPAFGADGGRTLPPLHLDRHGSSPGAEMTHHSGNSSSQILQAQVPAKSGASALVDQLRELDLPTADLASYGHRAQSPGGSGSNVASWLAKGAPALGPVLPPPQERSKNYQVSTDSHPYRQQAPFDRDGSSPQQARPADGNFARGHLPPHMLTPTALASSSSADFASDPYGRPMDVVPEAAEDVEMAVDTPEPAYEPPPQQPSPALPQQPAVKKKKWGLGSVFGHNNSDKQAAEAQPAALSLKRTQSGSIADNRMSAAPPPPTNLDPRKAKKEAEKQAKELERAKREAAERAQKERARAVMQKRTVLEQERKKAGAKTEFEWSSVEKPSAPTSGQAGKSLFGLANASVRSHGDAVRGYDEAHVYGGSSDGSQSQSSLQQAPSIAHSRLSGQSLQALQAQGSPLLEAAKAQASRAKARRRDDDDDHSTSSIASSHQHMMSTATIDSDPGPTRSPRQYAYNPGRSTSTSSFNLRDLQMRSNPSLSHLAQSNTSLGQLAQDFATHANVQSGGGPYGSTSSLGRYAPSSSSMSGPTTPYGHPLSHAVARGDGTGRHNGMLPSIADWEHHAEEEQAVNPMFRVPPPQGYSSKPTLPPFSAIASVADTQPKARRTQS